MILAETTIVIDFLRAPTPRALQIIQGHQAAICGVTVAEIYAGARSPADFARYRQIRDFVEKPGATPPSALAAGWRRQAAKWGVTTPERALAG